MTGWKFTALRVASIAVAGAFAFTAHANPSTRCWNVSPGVDKCRIEEPEVKKASTDYPAVTFRPFDRVTISAGGCAQTGGHGKTWKLYVYPQGANSDRLYHGKIWIPGATAGLVRIATVINQTVAIPANVSGFLRLGYEDDNYGDNGYWGHDDGNNDQCKNVGAAWVELTIQHNCAPGQTSCGGRCVVTATDPANCGACGVVCSGGQTCQGGRCACPAGMAPCGGRCVNLSTDPANCGACGKACATGQVCQGSTCVCAPGYTICNGVCVNLLTDPNHCGNCVRVCSPGQTCANGACQ